MELEEMKSLWTQMSAQLDEQKSLTQKLIVGMTQQRYSARFDKLFRIEATAAIVCLVGALYVVLNFGQLDSWYYQLIGVFTLLGLVGLPLIVLSSIQHMRGFDIAARNYKDTLVEYARRKQRFLLIQRASTGVSLMLALIVLPLASKLIKGEDFFAQSHNIFLWVFIGAEMIALIFFARWGYRCYKSISQSAENTLLELEKNE